MMTPDEFSLVQANRAKLYRLFGRLFRAPLSQDDIEALAAARIGSLKSEDAAFDHGMHVMERYLEKRHTGTRAFLGRDFTAAFLGMRDEAGRYALPYESAFVDATQHYMGTARGKVYNIYKKQALKLAEGIDLPEDHLAFMCEFMATLADRAVEARAASDMTALRENLLLSQAFLKHHILNWYPEFSALAARLVDERFYRGLLEAAGAFFALDAKVLRDLVKDEKAKDRSFDLARWELANAVPVDKEGVYPQLNRHRCLRVKGMTCDRCTAVCPEAVDPVANRKHEPKNACTACGACVAVCPEKALSL